MLPQRAEVGRTRSTASRWGTGHDLPMLKCKKCNGQQQQQITQGIPAMPEPTPANKPCQYLPQLSDRAESTFTTLCNPSCTTSYWAILSSNTSNTILSSHTKNAAKILIWPQCHCKKYFLQPFLASLRFQTNTSYITNCRPFSGQVVFSYPSMTFFKFSPCL